MLILKKTIVPCLSGCGFFVTVGRPAKSVLQHKHTHIFMTFMLHFTVFFITCIV